MNNKQQKTLFAIFAKPVPNSIEWSEVESLINALGGEIKHNQSRSYAMIYKNYHAQISYSEEDDVFIGLVVNVEHDIIAFDGYSVEELKQAFKTVIDDYLLDCAKAGKQPESPLLEEIAA